MSKNHREWKQQFSEYYTASGIAVNGADTKVVVDLNKKCKVAAAATTTTAATNTTAGAKTSTKTATTKATITTTTTTATTTTTTTKTTKKAGANFLGSNAYINLGENSTYVIGGGAVVCVVVVVIRRRMAPPVNLNGGTTLSLQEKV